MSLILTTLATIAGTKGGLFAAGSVAAKVTSSLIQGAMQKGAEELDKKLEKKK